MKPRIKWDFYDQHLGYLWNYDAGSDPWHNRAAWNWCMARNREIHNARAT